MTRKKNVKKIIEARELIDRYLDINSDLKNLKERKSFFENFEDGIEGSSLLMLIELKIQKREKYLETLLSTKVSIN